MDTLWRSSTLRADLAVLDVFSSRVLRLSSSVSKILARRKIPMIAILHGGALLEKFADIEMTLRPVLLNATHIVSPSKFLKQGFEELGFEVECIPNALEFDRFPYLERAAPSDPVRLLWVRAFTEIYRPNWPIEIVAELGRRGIPCRLTMIGPDKGLMPAAKERATELGVGDRVDFLGPVPNEELATHYHDHDFLLNTTQFESFGVALAESAATGLPIISAAVGEVKHSWKDDQDIFLVAGNRSEEFADRIAGLIENDPNGERYRAVSVAAREKVSEFAMPNILPRWQELIESVCHGRAC